MREILQTAGIAAAALLLIGLAVFAWRDASTFVPAPEVVTEGFARQITTRRFDLAVNYLASGTKKTETPRMLASRFDPLFAATGKVNRVDAEPQSMQQERAAARAIIKGDDGKTSFDVGLIRENGLWKIDRLPDLVR